MMAVKLHLAPIPKMNKTKKLLALTCLFALNLSLANVAHAQKATSSPQTTQNLKARIERIVEEKKDQITGIINNLDSTKQGFIGQVIRISEEAVTVKTNKATRILPITSDVELLKGTTKMKLADLAVDNWLVVMGVVEDDNFKPIRILVSTEDIRPRSYLTALGTISESDKTTFTIVPRDNPEAIEVTTNTKTVYEDLKGEEIKRTDIETDMQALVIAYDDEGDKIATRIRVLTVITQDEN